MIIEQVVRDFLAERLDDTPIFCEYPDGDKPTEFVVVELTGHGQRQQLDSATIALQSTAGSLYAAATLSARVIAAVNELPTLPNVSRARLENEYNFTDARKKEYRYQAVVSLVYMQ